MRKRSKKLKKHTMKRKLILLNGSIMLGAILFLFSCNDSNKQKGNSFTVKKYKDLPSWWFEKAELVYMLNDNRIVEDHLVKFIGGYVPNKGEIFFINNSEIVFSKNQIKIEKTGTVITKTFKSGEYTIKMIWDTGLTAGAYRVGEINLYINNISVINSPLIIMGW